MASVDPSHQQEYTDRADDLVATLEALDRDLSSGLADHQGDALVTTHKAFSYFADRYGLRQVAINGIDPDAEPSPARMREVAAEIRPLGVTTVFFEDQASPKIAEALASEAGAATAVLNPIEMPPAQGDYVSAMRTNLKALQEGLTP
jgi:zinc transport system substrate-binding protein